MAARRSVVGALAVWLVLSSLPFSLGGVAAAPPDADAVRDESPAAESLATDSRNEAEDARPEADDRRLPAANDPSASGSVRRRGLEAPVQLRQETADVPRQDAKPADPGDGPPASSRGGSGKRASEKSREDKPSRGLRVWPMRADSYSFSQAFGCVPQIAHFYQPGAGCPAEAPVIHHGIDMAAPEGTPFYAAASGWVTESGYDREVGVANTRIIIQHEGRNDGYATEYLHWIASFVEVGDYVEAGEFIGEVGSVGYSTGPHLHFSIIDLDTGGNLDPVSWLPDEAGNDAYRGRQPKEKASMRLPAGTTAGVPEFTDPAPPPPPERNDLREAGVDHQGRDRADRQDKRDRKEKKKPRAAKRADRTGATAGEDDRATADESARKNRKGKNTERTRTRERNKDGQRTERSARGEDGSGEKRRERSNRKSTDATNGSSDEEPSGKRSGKKSEIRSRSEENKVKQRETDSGSDGQDNERKDRKAEERAREDADAAPAPAPERDRDKRKRKNNR